MTDRIQELMEEIGERVTLHYYVDEWAAWCIRSSTYFGSTPIEALTKLRDKVKPRTPEQVMDMAYQNYSDDALTDDQLAVMANALRDADMLKDGA